MSHYKRDNSGGYGNPPVAGQFKLGGAGGPGRPKGSTDPASALRKVFRGKVPFLENGERKTAPAAEALAKRALQLGLSGPHRANVAALELAAKYGTQPDEPQNDELKFMHTLTAQEMDLLGQLLAKASGTILDPSDIINPFSYVDDPDDSRNYVHELTVDGIYWRRSSIGPQHNKISSIYSRAYASAVRPRPRSTPFILFEGEST